MERVRGMRTVPGDYVVPEWPHTRTKVAQKILMAGGSGWRELKFDAARMTAEGSPDCKWQGSGIGSRRRHVVKPTAVGHVQGGGHLVQDLLGRQCNRE